MDGDPITNQIKEFTVGIKTIDGTDLGTGTILTTDGVIATCFHVIKDKDENRPYESVKVYSSADLDSCDAFNIYHERAGYGLLSFDRRFQSELTNIRFVQQSII